MRRAPHHAPVGDSQWKERRVANVQRANAALRSHAATTPRPPDPAYAAARAAAPGAILGYGIDHKGAWARVGDARARAETPAAAIAAAMAKHREGTCQT